MKPYVLWLRARPLPRLAPLLVIVAVTPVLAGPVAFAMGFSWDPDGIRRVGLSEIASVVLAASLGYGCRGLLWQVEHLSNRRLGLLSGGLAVVAAALPTGTMTLAVFTRPPLGDPTAYLSTILVLAAISLAVGPLVNPAASWAAPLLVFLATLVVQVLWTQWGQTWWPLADPRVEGENRWPIALTALAVAIAIQTITRGGTVASSRRLVVED